MANILFHKLAILGPGLIGSSIAHAARRAGVVGQIVAHSRSAATRAEAVSIGVFDAVTDTAAEAVADADLVILCVPVGACGPVAQEIAPALKQGAILSDVGSVKAAIVNAVLPHVPTGVHFVPGHPIAGTEHSGPLNGFAALFDKRWCILTPLADQDPAAAEKLTAFWEALGADVELMDVAHHDRVLAITSHIPHLFAYNIVGTAANLADVTESEVIEFSAGGFRDFTRIAASDPTMWRDVFLNNKEAVLELLALFQKDLKELTDAIEAGDGDTLFNHFSRTRKIRTEIVDAGQETAAPDFGRSHTPKDDE
ncbi:MAG: prephenate/arogenate dehydrogenase family protein [Alphaproteobacteria bacterium]